jgi:hypothetical protein
MCREPAAHQSGNDVNGFTSTVGPLMGTNIPQSAVKDASGLFESEHAFIEKSLDQGCCDSAAGNS